jgi:outer membrane protein, heavy metal efflux system
MPAIAFIAVMAVLGGCRAGKQIQDCEYGPLQCAVSSHPRPGTAPESMLVSSQDWQPVQLVVREIRTPEAEEGEPPDASGENEPGEPVIANTLDELTGLVLDRNPEVQIARKELDIAIAQIPQASSLDDPMLDINSWPFSPNVPQSAGGRMQTDIGIAQKIPWKGKITARVGESSREVNSAEHKLVAAGLRVAAEARVAWTDLWLARQAEQIARGDIELLKGLVDSAEALYETGKATQESVLRLQSEIAQAENAVTRAKSDQQKAEAELARVLHLPPGQPAAISPTAPEIPEAGDAELLIAQALAARPELLSAVAEIQRDEWRVRQARLDYYPDITFRAGWGAMTTSGAIAPTADGIDQFNAGINLELPVRRARRDAAVREAEAMVVAGAFEIDRLRDETIRDIRQLHSQLASDRAQIASYRNSIIPAIEQALDVSLKSFEVDRASLSDINQIRRDLLRIRMELLGLQASEQKTWAALQRIAVIVP